MSLIVDTNQIAAIFDNEISGSFETKIRKFIFSGSTILVCGGRLKREYLEVRKALPDLTRLFRMGLLRYYNDNQVDQEEARYSDLSISSDDPHVLALARISGCRVLISRDHRLAADFKNPKFLQPKGSVINKVAHDSVLRRAKSRRK